MLNHLVEIDQNSGGIARIHKVLEKDVTVTTPAGTFTNAIKVQRGKLNERGEV
ncbi:hypothetical protein GTZ93_23765 [Corallococcus exiguus]|uniref:Uncharacterized protein n=1 Tax=Corallococcus exiguus TaxID=83462 RepID=A0A7X5BV29_9BACT|nr:hypothetical protein [Corallococcus exiguus]